ncbi:hypothetical protein RhiirA5_366366, partial [Rhizophagus irregularis]
MLWKLFVKLFDYEKAHFGIIYKSLADDIGQLEFNITRQMLSNFYCYVSLLSQEQEKLFELGLTVL